MLFFLLLLLVVVILSSFDNSIQLVMLLVTPLIGFVTSLNWFLQCHDVSSCVRYHADLFL
jgi:hypothetical protein